MDNERDQEEKALRGESDESRKANPGSGIRFSQLASHTEKVDRSISRVLSWTVIHLGLASPQTSSNLPGSSAGHANGSLFGLAPGGVYPATTVASGAVRSYRTFSPLPVPSKGGNRRYLLCGTSRSHTVTSVAPRRYLAPCPVEPGLSSSGYAASDCLTDPGRSLGVGGHDFRHPGYRQFREQGFCQGLILLAPVCGLCGGRQHQHQLAALLVAI